jgi:hypothetical protein
MEMLETGGNLQEIATSDAADQGNIEETTDVNTSSSEASTEEGTVEKEQEETSQETIPEKIAEKPAVTKDEKEGLIQARKAEAAKRREAQQEAAVERGRREQLEKMIEKFNQPQEQQFDPNEPITIGQAQEMLRKQREEESISRQQSQVIESVNRTRDKYKDSEFTYDDAYEWAMSGNIPKAMMGAVLADPSNAGQLLYDLVQLRHPDLRKNQTETIQTEAVKKTTEAINRHINTPRTLSNATGTDKSLDNIKAIESMSYNDFQALVESNMRKSG